MNIFINLSNRLISEALHNILTNTNNSYHAFVAGNKGAKDIKPDIIVVDFNVLSENLFSLYPDSKIVLLDTGLKQEDIIAVLLSYNISGVLSQYTSFSLFKKALQVINEGEIWMDNETVKAILDKAGTISKKGEIKCITDREREIVKFVCQGLKNNEIASSLFISEQTVKAHLNRIFRKLNVSNRSQLVAVALRNMLLLAVGLFY